MLKKSKSRFSSFWLKHSISNLSRPNNQTGILITTLGFAGALIFTMLFSRDVLLGQLQLQGGEDEPNMILFDIRENQRAELSEFSQDFGLPIMQEVPIVAMRIQAINGNSIATIKADSTSKVRTRTLEREFRVSFRDTLIETEQIVKGEWIGETNQDDFIPISLEERTAESLQVGIGDTITYNVQGLPMNTVVKSLRTVNFNRIQTNFTTLFPKGILENAPKFYVIVSRTSSKKESARFQNQLVTKFPNVSVIDLELILSTVKDITSRINYVVQFMALFSLATGLLVLLSTLINVRFQRIKENILLRTLGAQRKTLVAINLGEFILLGFSSTFAAVLLSTAITYAINITLFQSVFNPSGALLAACLFGGIGIIVLISVLVNRGIYNRPPLEVLRTENA